MELTGKNVVYVGGLGGIGNATCRELFKKNVASIVLLDFQKNDEAVKALQAINPKIKVVYIEVDITRLESIKAAIGATMENIPYIDVLINGAGVIADRNVEFTIGVNLIGLIHTTMEALPFMDKNRGGRGGLIVNVASVLGLEPGGAMAVYSASKFGVIGFTRSLADPYYHELTGVAVLAICPGITKTPLVLNLNGIDTFDYSKPLSEKFLEAEIQSAEICAHNFVQAIESNQNGAMWIAAEGGTETVLGNEVQLMIYSIGTTSMQF